MALPPAGRGPASKEEWLPVRYVRIMLKLTEVLFALFKLVGGNWSALFALATCMFDLQDAWREPRAAHAL